MGAYARESLHLCGLNFIGVTMAKEDILEQIVEEYLLHAGYFVRHNLKFRPSKEDQGFTSREIALEKMRMGIFG